MRKKPDELENGAMIAKLVVNAGLSEDEKETILLENYSRYPIKQMHILTIGLIEIFKNGKITPVEFIMTCSYLLGNIYIKDLASTYIVDYDSECPHTVSKQYIHREMVTKILPEAAETGSKLLEETDFSEANSCNLICRTSTLSLDKNTDFHYT